MPVRFVDCRSDQCIYVLDAADRRHGPQSPCCGRRALGDNARSSLGKHYCEKHALICTASVRKAVDRAVRPWRPNCRT